MKLKAITACCAAVSLSASGATSAGTLAPAAAVAPATAPQTAAQRLAAAQRNVMIAALRKRVKYVFVLYQENRSFDSYFGTFPGADGIYSRGANATLGFTQRIENVDGSFATISPFRIGPKEYAADTDDVDHSHPRLIKKIDVTSAGPQMDQFALTEEQKYIAAGKTLPTLKAKQYGELTMAYEDCDTVPLLWNYANRFVLFDHVFASNVGPSTPGNLAIIGAQAGQTQDALHPSEGYTDNGSSAAGVPVMNDRDPAWGPYNPGDGATPASVQLNLTYATLPLTLAGREIAGLPASDPHAALDFADVGNDVRHIARENKNPFGWGWFEEGYDLEPGQPSAAASLTSYIAHHNGPQYFGYVANSNARRNLHGLGDFATAVSAGRLPQQGGVFYVKGGFQNILGLRPADPDPTVQKNFAGDDDHPGYSDAQISEANVAESVNRIAASKYWSQSAIIVTWDDSEGDYDHVAPPLRSIGPGVGNLPQDYITNGPRVPLIVISPFAKVHRIERATGDQGSVVKFVNAVFGLTPLAELPDEERGLSAGQFLGKINYGPGDAEMSGVTNLLDAFDAGRLTGRVAPLPASYAYVDPYFIRHLPQATGLGCGAIGVIPVDYLRGVRNRIPPDFNPRPGTNPTQPAEKAIDTRALVRNAHDPED